MFLMIVYFDRIVSFHCIENTQNFREYQQNCSVLKEFLTNLNAEIA